MQLYPPPAFILRAPLELRSRGAIYGVDLLGLSPSYRLRLPQTPSCRFTRLTQIGSGGLRQELWLLLRLMTGGARLRLSLAEWLRLGGGAALDQF